MKKHVNIVYAISWVVLLAAGYAFFPVWKGTVLIPVMILFGIGSWLYGSTVALILILFTTIYLFSLYNVFHVSIPAYFEDRIIGPLLAILVVYLTQAQRSAQDRLRRAASQLESGIQKRQEELNFTATQLIEKSEHNRILMGEELHDSVGQELTGIQLFCGSLAENLKKEDCTSAALTLSLQTSAAQAHHMVRAASRTLFPIKMTETGMPAALEEMAAFYQETRNTHVSISGHNALNNVQDPLCLQIYRICQESALLVLDSSNSNSISFEFDNIESTIVVNLGYDDAGFNFEQTDDIIGKLIRYRLLQIGGDMRSCEKPRPRCRISFTISEKGSPT